jgi:hypothetical protein
MNGLEEVISLLERIVSLLEEVKVEVTEENRRDFSYEVVIDPCHFVDGDVAVPCEADWTPF